MLLLLWAAWKEGLSRPPAFVFHRDKHSLGFSHTVTLLQRKAKQMEVITHTGLQAESPLCTSPSTTKGAHISPIFVMALSGGVPQPSPPPSRGCPWNMDATASLMALTALRADPLAH